ncbi:MAG: hypothetical protein ACLP5O_00325 [Acidimicrobiales bacterium]
MTDSSGAKFVTRSSIELKGTKISMASLSRSFMPSTTRPWRAGGGHWTRLA